VDIPTSLCGASVMTCPYDTHTGDEIDPDEGCPCHQDICPDHPCEDCMGRAIDGAMNQMEIAQEDGFYGRE
jgi:hypothetical protein